MKLRTKIIVVFILSIIISVIIFLFAIWYLISNGWWSGITTNDMNQAVEGATGEIQTADSFRKENIEPILNSWKNRYSGMELELLSEQAHLICTTAQVQQINNMKELISSLSKHGRFSQERWVSAREIELTNGNKGYIVIVVPVKYFTALTFSINWIKGTGIFGQMFLIGLGITLIISCSFAYLFTRRISKRFALLFSRISSLELGNLEIELCDNSQDELGSLTTTFKTMAERLKKQIDSKKAYQEERKKLVSNISHDLRTPLTSIIGYSESLENNVFEGEEEQRKHISIIRKKAIYMDKLLVELLEFSRIETGMLELRKQNADIAELAREILIEYLPVLGKSNIELIADIPEQPLEIYIDKDMISRVIRNLMDNAIKYGMSGKMIEFSITDEHDAMRIEVNDYGPGIDNENLKMIFKRFYREDKSRATKNGGMGLGLAISDEIIKLHDGKIDVESSLGKGTLFAVSLPKRT